MKYSALFLALCLVIACAVPASAASLEVAGKSAILMEMDTGTVLYEQNAHEKLPPASVTKVMTMLLVMEAIDAGRIGWEDLVTVSESAAAKGGSQIYLKVGEQMSVSDMLKSVAVSSANDCACALAEFIAGSESAFVEQMNIRAGQLKMFDTHFVNCTGLDDDPEAKNHLTSAYDIAIMSRELMLNHPDIQKFTTIWMDTVRNGAFGLSNTNKLIRFYPGATGLKTGFTSGAGYCLSATAQRDGMGLIAVVLGAKTSQERFAGCKALLDYGFANFALVRPELPAENKIPVKLGTEKSVTAVPGENVQLLIDKAQKNSVNIQLTLEEELTAPVSKGQKIGTLTVRAGEQILSRVPMVAGEAVPKLRWWDVFLQMLHRVAMGKM